MADLDSFFAKKGKKKKSKSSKKQPDSLEGSEDKIVQLTVNTTQEEETEWKEVQDTVKISADDLKVQTLVIEEPSKDAGTPNSKTSSSSKTHDNPSKGKEQDANKANVASPWQPLQKEKECTSPTTTVTNIIPPTSSSGAYVPPSKRSYVPPSRRTKPDDPPDITSESAFPSLVSGVGGDSETKKKKIPCEDDDNEDDDTHQRVMYTELRLQNKFDGLRNE